MLTRTQASRPRPGQRTGPSMTLSDYFMQERSDLGVWVYVYYFSHKNRFSCQQFLTQKVRLSKIIVRKVINIDPYSQITPLLHSSQSHHQAHNSEKIWTYSSSRSFRVMDLGDNWRHICNLVVTSVVSRTVFETSTHKARKQLIFPIRIAHFSHPTLVWRPRSGGTRQNFWLKLTTTLKLEGLGYPAVKDAWS